MVQEGEDGGWARVGAVRENLDSGQIFVGGAHGSVDRLDVGVRERQG